MGRSSSNSELHFRSDQPRRLIDLVNSDFRDGYSRCLDHLLGHWFDNDPSTLSRASQCRRSCARWPWNMKREATFTGPSTRSNKRPGRLPVEETSMVAPGRSSRSRRPAPSALRPKQNRRTRCLFAAWSRLGNDKSF